ncbi:MAG: NAD-binding protein [Pseudomonadota bacterium]
MMNINKILIAIIFCGAIIVAGTVGYMVIDGYPPVDAFYMAVITISTVGYGEIRPLSDAGRIFTIFLILTGIGSLAFVGHAVVESLLEKVWFSNSEAKKMKRRIDQLKGHYIICGFGRVGESAVEHFSEAKTDFLLIESSPEQCQLIKSRGYLYIEGDATSESTLLDAGIKSASGLLALLDSDPKNLFIALTARELNPTLHIIARSADKTNRNKILRAGADSVISPYSSAGTQVANDLLLATGRAKLVEATEKFCAIPQWIDVVEGSSMVDSSIGKVAQEMGREIVGLRRGQRDYIHPDPHIVLETDDRLFVLEEGRGGDSLIESTPVVPKKIVIVDDNPVIVRLYARLLQKAGFYPLTAANGNEGLDLIIREEPAVAVIDYQLPGLSGIEICERIRQNPAMQDVKLILFTGDDEPQTRKEALNRGADEVVLKSPEASDVIDAVVRLLKAD